MESLQAKRRKILLLFLLGVGLPSLALGYLALRGIRNEQALLAQRRLDDHRTVARALADLVVTEIDAAEQMLRAAVEIRQPAEPDSIEDALREVTQQPLVEDVLYLDPDGRLTLPAEALLYRDDGALAASATRTWPAGPAAEMRAARRQEFQLRQYGSALAGYRRAYAAVSDQALRGEALLAVARVQQNAGRSVEALESYGMLADAYGHVRTASGVPLGPTACLQRATLLLDAGETEAALDAVIGLYEGMAGSLWPLERAQYDNFSREAANAADGALMLVTDSDTRETYRRRLDQLQTAETARRAQTERLLLLQRSEGLTAGVGGPGGATAAAGRRVTFESAGQTYLVSWLDRPPAGGTWGLLVDEQALGDLVGEALDARIDPANTAWVVTGRDGRPLFTGADRPATLAALKETFPDSFPPWLVEFHDRPQSPYRLLFASGQSVYVYMFVLIAGILGFGFVLTVRAVSHELELARLKSDFVSSVSHEFKSPLTAISHLSEMLQAGSVRSAERRRQYYDVLVEQSARLSSLVTNILDLARIDEGRQELRFEVIDPGALVRDLVTTVEHRVAHEGQTIDLAIEEPLPPIRADRTALARALTNLLDNAIKYSPDHNTIEVRVSADTGRVAITVRDHGVGIPASEIGHVFDRFYRGGHALAHAVKGSGLGLTLVREIVDAHGGTVRATSVPGQGSTFTIELPAITE